VYFTTKSYGVAELKALGCKHVIFCGNAYDPHCHRPVQLSEGERKLLGGPVGFIGAFESQRAESMYRLAHSGFQIRIWGPGWERCRLRHPNLIVEHKPLWGEDYAKAISAFDINLCFLRKINRDLQTTRSVEIPACGGFMLAERTEEHLGLFEEGKEAEFFSSDEELISKVGFYHDNPEMRKGIAAAGRERCIKSGYSNHYRLKKVFAAIDRVQAGVV
jgi:spore maturation protein CgeB